MHCILVEYKIVLTYVDNMSKGRVRSELTDPANRHLYMRSKTEEKKKKENMTTYCTCYKVIGQFELL